MAASVPVPVITAEMLPFWKGLKEEKLLLMKCKQCGAWRWPYGGCRTHPNGPFLDNLEWTVASGRGKVFSYTVSYIAFHPAFKDSLPYIFALIELDEGPVMPVNLVQCKPEHVYIEMPVEVKFERIDDELNYPVFKPLV